MQVASGRKQQVTTTDQTFLSLRVAASRPQWRSAIARAADKDHATPERATLELGCADRCVRAARSRPDWIGLELELRVRRRALSGSQLSPSGFSGYPASAVPNGGSRSAVRSSCVLKAARVRPLAAIECLLSVYCASVASPLRVYCASIAQNELRKSSASNMRLRHEKVRRAQL